MCILNQNLRNFITIPWCVSPMRIKSTVVIMSTFQKKQVNNHLASIGLMSDQHDDPSVITDFLDWNYHYKSVATQILLDPGWAQNPNTGQTFFSHRRQSNDASINKSSQYYALNCLTR